MRIATFNMLHGRSPADGRVDPDRFVSAIRDLDADILALQEVDRDQPRSGRADFTALAASAMGAVAHRFVAALAGTPGATWVAATGSEQPGTATYGVALLARYPVRSWQVTRLAPIRFPFPIWLPGPRKVLVVREEPRVAVTAMIDSPLGRLADLSGGRAPSPARLRTVARPPGASTPRHCGGPPALRSPGAAR